MPTPPADLVVPIPLLRDAPLDGWILCWDLDGALGRFAPMWDPVPRVGACGATPGMHAVLTQLTAAGCTHAVVTRTPLAYADEVLDRSGLRPHIAHVWGGEAHAGYGQRKRYAPVAEAFALFPAEVRHRLVAIGGHDDDAPADLEGVVLVQPEAAWEYPAGVLLGVLCALAATGDGSPARGFDALATLARPVAIVGRGGIVAGEPSVFLSDDTRLHARMARDPYVSGGAPVVGVHPPAELRRRWPPESLRWSDAG
jgi:hypothetical protein